MSRIVINQQLQNMQTGERGLQHVTQHFLLHRPQTLLQELPPVFIRSPGRQSQQQNCQPQNQSRNIFFCPYCHYVSRSHLTFGRIFFSYILSPFHQV